MNESDFHTTKLTLAGTKGLKNTHTHTHSMNDESQTKESNGVTASPIGSFFANAKKKMEKVASTLDAKATALFDKKSSTAPRCVVPTDVYSTFTKKLAHPCKKACLCV